MNAYTRIELNRIECVDDDGQKIDENMASEDLTEAPDFVYAVAVQMSLLRHHHLGLALSRRIALISPRIAGTRAGLGLAGLGVLPLAARADAAGDAVRAGGDDGAVVVRVRVRGAGGGGEERVGRVAVPAAGAALAHGLGVAAPGPDGPDARVAVGVLAGAAAGDAPEVGAVARQRPLHHVLAHDRVRVAEDVADVVARPLAHRVRFQHRPAVLGRVGVVADADLPVPLPELHAAFGRAGAAGHDVAVAVGFVEGDFVA